MRYDAEWDPKKARVSIRKHKISFERAAGDFRDPNHLLIPDEKLASLMNAGYTGFGLNGKSLGALTQT